MNMNEIISRAAIDMWKYIRKWCRIKQNTNRFDITVDCKDGPSNVILASIESIIYATILYSRPKQNLIPVTAVWCAILKSRADVYSNHMLDNARLYSEIFTIVHRYAIINKNGDIFTPESRTHIGNINDAKYNLTDVGFYLLWTEIKPNIQRILIKDVIDRTLPKLEYAYAYSYRSEDPAKNKDREKRSEDPRPYITY